MKAFTTSVPVLFLAFSLTLPSIAAAHIPKHCDPFIDHFVEATAAVSVTLDEYHAWLEPRKDRVYNLTKEEAADLVSLIRDSDEAQLKALRATRRLFECIG